MTAANAEEGWMSSLNGLSQRTKSLFFDLVSRSFSSLEQGYVGLSQD